MLKRAAARLVFSLTSIIFVGCRSKPANGPAPATAPAATVAPAEPTSKCGAVSDGCKATAEARVAIPNSDLQVILPAGWAFAKDNGVTVAQASDDAAALAFGVVDTKDAKPNAAFRNQALSDVAAHIHLASIKQKIPWKHPMDSKSVGSLKVNLWQVDKASRGEAKGPLVIFSADLPNNKILFGVGFVPEDDHSGADELIMKAVDSIAVTHREVGGKL